VAFCDKNWPKAKSLKASGQKESFPRAAWRDGIRQKKFDKTQVDMMQVDMMQVAKE
jgi:hypothetical protein